MKKLNFLVTKEQHIDHEWKGDLGDGVINGGRQCPVNLFNGLKKLGIDLEYTFPKDEIKNDTLNVSMNGDSLNSLLKYGKNILDNSVIGPIGVGTPEGEEDFWLFKNVKHCIVHTNWVEKIYKKCLNDSIIDRTKTEPHEDREGAPEGEIPEVNLWKNYDFDSSFEKVYPINFHKWAVGIDSDFFKPEKKEKDLDCFIYEKWRGDSIDESVVILKKLNLKYEIIAHGNYTQEELKKVCNRSKFCIHVSMDETQNMAGMEILSCDVPILVLDFNFNHYIDYCESFEYFNDDCGIKLKQWDYYPRDNRGRGVDNYPEALEENIIKMSKNYTQYSPREYILNSHTLEKSAENFMNIVNRIS